MSGLLSLFNLESIFVLLSIFIIFPLFGSFALKFVLHKHKLDRKFIKVFIASFSIILTSIVLIIAWSFFQSFLVALIYLILPSEYELTGIITCVYFIIVPGIFIVTTHYCMKFILKIEKEDNKNLLLVFGIPYCIAFCLLLLVFGLLLVRSLFAY